MNSPRPFTGDTLVIATHNKGKVPEIAALLDGLVTHFPTAGELGLGEPEETETTYVGNAILKARAAASTSGLPALADDSGLSVDGLGGDPGIYSARWAGPTKDFYIAMARVEEALKASPDRKGDRAAFICALALAWPDGHVEVVEGRVDGRLSFPPRGTNGFGYNPIFIPDGFDQTIAEMDPSEKQAISHRTDAFTKLKARCFAGR